MRLILPDVITISLFTLWVGNGDILSYLASQGAGQMRILTRTETRESYLAKADTPPHHSDQLKLVDEIKAFAFDSLGLKRTKSYTRIYDQKGKALLWVITASRPFALEPKTWKFPITGEVTYKGFFKKADAEQEKQNLEQRGWETRIREVNAWSTLGYFNDPILSEMLNLNPGDLANVLIHELSHSTVFIPGDVEESENLASFIGDVGAGRFLRMKYGADSPEVFEYETSDSDQRKFSEHLLRGALRLDSLYASADFISLIESRKNEEKNRMIRKVISDLDTVNFALPGRFDKLKKGKLPNNAFFVQFRQYHARQNKFYEEFESVYKGNLREYMDALKEKYAR